MSTKNENLHEGQFLTFLLGQEHYGVHIESVREINRVGEITPVPKTPSFVKGVMNLRGKIIPVINLRLKFAMEEVGHTRDTCIIVMETPSGQMGMIVDAVKEVVDLKANELEQTPEMGDGQANQFVMGLGKLENRVIILVDVVAALSPAQLQELSELSGVDEHAA